MPFDLNHKNLALWRREMPTDTHWLGDKKTTSDFRKGGGFGGTALNASYVVARLTQAFGPIGHGWGLVVKDAREVEAGHTKDGQPQWLQLMTATFWYVHDGDRGEFDVCGGTTIEGRGDDDARKKSLTDCLTKAASWIGVGADIHSGKWNDNKYVSEREQETRSAARERAAADKAALRQSARMVREALEAAVDLDQLAEARGQALKLHPLLVKAELADEVEELAAAVLAARARVAPPRAAAE